MTMPHCLLIGLFCLGPLAAPAGAELLPMKEQQLAFSLQDRMAVRNIAGQIVARAGPDFSGYIQLVWFDHAYASGAQQLRQLLVSRGISPQRIMLIQEIGAGNQPVPGLRVRIKSPTVSRSLCRYTTQNYRFNIHEQQGCALNSTLRSSLINPQHNSY